MTNMSFDQINSLAPTMKPQYKQAMQAADVNQLLTKYGISKSPLRLCHFIAQVLAETGALSTIVESLNYSASRLMQVWPRRFPTIEIAQQFAHDEEKLGNFVYGGRMGNTNPGDGFRYRGRGLLQMTGRSAYNRYGAELGLDLTGDPDLAFDAADCLEIAAAEWAASGAHGKSCNELADEDNIEGVTLAINGGQTGIADRRLWLTKAKAIWLKPHLAELHLASRAIANLEVEEFGFEPQAEPAAARQAAPGALVAPVPEARPATAFDPKEAAFLGEFVAAAYAMYHADPTNLTPPAPSNFPRGYKLIASVQMRDFILWSTDPVFYGFLAQSVTDLSRFVLAIRGTSNAIEWWDDVNAGALIPFKTHGCGAVGAGFARIYDTLEVVEYPGAAAQPTVAAASRSLKAAGGFSQQIAALVQRRAPLTAAAAPAAPPAVSVTGHSLGGALATLYALDNARTQRIQNPLLCTFASPRVGDATFAAAFNVLGLTSWRIANAPDLVPNIPPDFLGFRHVDALQAVDSRGKVTPSISCWHALATYLSLIDPALQPDADCRPAAGVAAIRAAPRAARTTTITAPAPSGGPVSINITVNLGEGA